MPRADRAKPRPESRPVAAGRHPPDPKALRLSLKPRVPPSPSSAGRITGLRLRPHAARRIFEEPDLIHVGRFWGDLFGHIGYTKLTGTHLFGGVRRRTSSTGLSSDPERPCSGVPGAAGDWSLPDLSQAPGRRRAPWGGARSRERSSRTQRGRAAGAEAIRGARERSWSPSAMQRPARMAGRSGSILDRCLRVPPPRGRPHATPQIRGQAGTSRIQDAAGFMNKASY